jgi:hypothetical protein
MLQALMHPLGVGCVSDRIACGIAALAQTAWPSRQPTGAEFETVEAPLEEPIASQYAAAAATWNRLFREFLYAEEQAAAAAGDAAAAPSGEPEPVALHRLGLNVASGCEELLCRLAVLRRGWHSSTVGSCFARQMARRPPATVAPVQARRQARVGGGGAALAMRAA